MEEGKKEYICLKATNQYLPGDTAFLTDEELANFNGNEPESRFELVAEKANEGASETAPATEAPAASTDAATSETDANTAA
jgi:hypothetical protein